MRFYMIVLTAYSILATVLLVLLIIQNRELKHLGAGGQLEVNYDEVVSIEVGDAPVLGPADAPITLVEFSDFECPACIAVSGAIDGLVDKYPGQVRRIYKHFPLAIHPKAIPAAAAAMAAHVQGQFWPMRDRLFALEGALDEEAYVAAAEAMNLDVDAFREDMKEAVWQELIHRDREEGLAAGVRGTPTFFVNGVRIPAVNPDVIEKVMRKLAPNLKRG